MAQPCIHAHGYPRPQLVRDQWTSLDGTWEYACEDNIDWRGPADVRWQRTITVPFAPETPASGVGDTGFHRVFWYRRTFDAPALLDRHAPDPPFRRGGLCRDGLGQRHDRCAPRGRLHTVQRGYHRLSRARTARRRSSCARTMTRSTSPSRAASRIGSASRIRSGTRAPRASGRRFGWKRCPRPQSGNSPGLPNLRTLGVRPGSVDRRPAAR